VRNLEDQLIEWGQWCRWDAGSIGPRRAGLVSSIWSAAGKGTGGRARIEPSAVVGERVQHALSKMVERQRRPELGKALGAWYAWANMATTAGPDHQTERLRIASAKCGVSQRTFTDQFVQARTAIAQELASER
jgi:hypothetical protein